MQKDVPFGLICAELAFMSDFDLRYPIGPFVMPDIASADLPPHYISDISSFAERMRMEVQHLSDEQLDTTYREGGWTVRQVVHHCADSHLNAFVRLKLALTEMNPIVKPYEEAKWAELWDSTMHSIEPSLRIIEGVHERWTSLLNHMSGKDLLKTYYHPEQKRSFSIEYLIALYVWHGNHHLAQIIGLKQRRGWI
jgi:uncharacterized damage-inducible protein DinB